MKKMVTLGQYLTSGGRGRSSKILVSSIVQKLLRVDIGNLTTDFCMTWSIFDQSLVPPQSIFDPPGVRGLQKNLINVKSIACRYIKFGTGLCLVT